MLIMKLGLPLFLVINFYFFLMFSLPPRKISDSSLPHTYFSNPIKGFKFNQALNDDCPKSSKSACPFYSVRNKCGVNQ